MCRSASNLDGCELLGEVTSRSVTVAVRSCWWTQVWWCWHKSVRLVSEVGPPSAQQRLLPFARRQRVFDLAQLAQQTLRRCTVHEQAVTIELG
jgi:hypothetical protein